MKYKCSTEQYGTRDIEANSPKEAVKIYARGLNTYTGDPQIIVSVEDETGRVYPPFELLPVKGYVEEDDEEK